MKTFLQILFFFLLVTQISFAQWYQRNSGTAKNLYVVQFIDENNGIAVGDSGTMLRTVNGGTSWTPITIGLTNNFSGMCFVDANNGWVVTSDGYYSFDTSVVLHTSDGGTTWTTQINIPNSNLNDITFINDSTGFAVGYGTDPDSLYYSYSFILRTTDGGLNWAQTVYDTISLITKICFVDANNGWIISNGSNFPPVGPRIYRTTDGGNSWVVQLELSISWVDPQHLDDIVFTDLNNGIAVGGGIEHFGIKKSIDGGTTWDATYGGIGPLLWDVFFLNVNEGLAVGGEGTILRTSDGGTSWEAQTSGTTNSLTNVYFTDALNGWVVGNNGTILHTTNGGVSFVEEEQIDEIPTEFLLSQNYPNPFNPSTKLSYSITQSGLVTLKVYDVLGTEIETLLNEEKPVGTYELNWNAANLPSGVYFYRLQAGSFVETKKMILLK